MGRRFLPLRFLLGVFQFREDVGVVQGGEAGFLQSFPPAAPLHLVHVPGGVFLQPLEVLGPATGVELVGNSTPVVQESCEFFSSDQLDVDAAGVDVGGYAEPAVVIDVPAAGAMPASLESGLFLATMNPMKGTASASVCWLVVIGVAPPMLLVVDPGGVVVLPLVRKDIGVVDGLEEPSLLLVVLHHLLVLRLPALVRVGLVDAVEMVHPPAGIVAAGAVPVVMGHREDLH